MEALGMGDNRSRAMRHGKPEATERYTPGLVTRESNVCHTRRCEGVAASGHTSTKTTSVPRTVEDYMTRLGELLECQWRYQGAPVGQKRHSRRERRPRARANCLKRSPEKMTASPEQEPRRFSFFFVWRSLQKGAWSGSTQRGRWSPSRIFRQFVGCRFSWTRLAKQSR